MPALAAEKKRATNYNSRSISSSYDENINLLPGLPDDVAKHCLALVPRSNFPSMNTVCKKWSHESHWEVLDCFGNLHRILPSMPGLSKVSFGVAVLNGKLIVIAGYSTVDASEIVSADVYQYDSCLNSWSKLANMNIPRYEFACAEVNGLIYVAGGLGTNGESLSSAEVYNPVLNKWTLLENMRRPRWGCFACALNGKLYVMGGRSSFTIGNSRFVDIYNPEAETWYEMKTGCVMVTAHAVVGKQLYCLEWKTQRKLSIFDSSNGLWKSVDIPLTGSLNIGFRFGVLDDKLLLLSVNKDDGYTTLVYSPDSEPGSEWQTSDVNPSGLCLSSITIKD